MLICKAKHLLYQSIYLLQKMGESTFKFDFERIVPVFLREPSRSVFCANRPGRIVPGRNWFLRETSRNQGSGVKREVCTLMRGQMSNSANQLGANVLTCHIWAGGKCPGGNMSYTRFRYVTYKFFPLFFPDGCQLQ